VTVAKDGRVAGVLRVVVLADDLIWASRLVGQLRTLGADPVRVGTAEGFAAALDGAGPAGSGECRPAHAVVDLTARAYDGTSAVHLAVAAGMRVLCVGQHDDRELRRSALAAGAERVFAYRALFENGHATLAAWLGVPPPAPGSIALPAPAPIGRPSPAKPSTTTPLSPEVVAR
jgi:hypothetical protein